jgi:hypothetical protein
MMKAFVTGLMLAGLFAVAGCSQAPQQPGSAGPNGGDLVPIKGGTAYAEVLANVDTGEVLVNTWDKDLKTRQPIENEPLSVGSGDGSVELTPHPMDTDPSGTCSRFYGEADWVRGGSIRHGWMHGQGTGATRSLSGSAAGRRAGRTATCGRRWARTGTWGRGTCPAGRGTAPVIRAGMRKRRRA